MPARIEPLENGEIYHLYNRGYEKRAIFHTERDFRRAMAVFWYYQFEGLNVKFSNYLRLEHERRLAFKQQLMETPPMVEVLAYCLMPNHYHLLVRQLAAGGISRFLGQFQNSYAHYQNLRAQHEGYVFAGRFKSVRMESEMQLIHTSRYIHLNPATAFLIRKARDLGGYPWSSYPAYLSGVDERGICDPSYVLDIVRGRTAYKKLVEGYVDYQRYMAEMKKAWIDVEM
jgi:putative transposase